MRDIGSSELAADSDVFPSTQGLDVGTWEPTNRMKGN
jgi:hypothetical protein